MQGIPFLHPYTRTHSSNAGIALGPILFIIAILAVIAATLASGSGAFRASTNAESAKVMASGLVTLCEDYQHAMQKMTMVNGCEPDTLDLTPPGWPTGSTSGWQHGDFTGGNGTNRAGNGSCTMFDMRGGGMAYKPVPSVAMMSNLVAAYGTDANGLNYDAFAGYPMFYGQTCLHGIGSCEPSATSTAQYKAAWILLFYYLNHDTCNQINARLSSTTTDPDSIPNNFYVSIYANSSNIGRNIQTGSSSWSTNVAPAWTPSGQICMYDRYSSTGSSYIFLCPILIR